MADSVFSVGEGAHYTIQFTGGSKKMRRVLATFEHEEDADAQFVLTGVPNPQGDDNWVAVLSGRVSDANKRGAYIYGRS